MAPGTGTDHQRLDQLSSVSLFPFSHQWVAAGDLVCLPSLESSLLRSSWFLSFVLNLLLLLEDDACGEQASWIDLNLCTSSDVSHLLAAHYSV